MKYISIKVERDPFFDAEVYRGQIAMRVNTIFTDDHECDVDCILIATINEQASIDCTLGGRYEEIEDVEARWINESGGATGRATVKDHTDYKNDSGEIYDFEEWNGGGTSNYEQRGAVRLVVNREKGTYSLYFPPVDITVKESFGSQGSRDNPHHVPGNYHGAFALENLPLPKSGNTLSGSLIIKREIEYPNGYSCNPEMEVTVNWSLTVV